MPQGHQRTLPQKGHGPPDGERRSRARRASTLAELVEDVHPEAASDELAFLSEQDLTIRGVATLAEIKTATESVDQWQSARARRAVVAKESRFAKFLRAVREWFAGRPGPSL